MQVRDYHVADAETKSRFAVEVLADEASFPFYSTAAGRRTRTAEEDGPRGFAESARRSW